MKSIHMAAEQNIDAERAAFEAWANSQNWICDRDSFGDYVYGTARDGWEAWQAARRSAAIGEGGLPELPKQTAWMVPVDGVYEYYATKRAAESERAGYEQVMGEDADHEEPEPLFTADKMRQYARDAIAADRRAREPAPQAAQGVQVELQAALDAYFPIPDNPHASVIQRAMDARHAMGIGWMAAMSAQLARQSQGEQDVKRYRMLRDSEKIPAAVWHALETGIWVDETIDGWIAETSPIPFCDPCKAGRYGECQYAIPCTIPASVAAPPLSSEQQAQCPRCPKQTPYGPVTCADCTTRELGEQQAEKGEKA